jgi:hypothetical protein
MYMNVGRAPARLTATATAFAAQKGMLFGVVLNGGSDAATAIVRDGGAGGTILASLKAAAATTVIFQPACFSLPFATDLHVTITGTAPEVLVYT